LLPRAHAGEPRQVKPGQLIHESVFDKIIKDRDYYPKACLYGGLDWVNQGELRSTIMEEDPYTKATEILDELQKQITDQRLDVFFTLINSSESCICHMFSDDLILTA
jgi:hypothetical protein